MQTRPRCTRCAGIAGLLIALLAPTTGLAERPTHLNEKVEDKLNSGLGAPPEQAKLDRSTPRRSWSALLAQCSARRYDRAAHLLNLGQIPESEQKATGAVVARKLCEVLDAVEDKQPASAVDDTAVGPIAEDKPTNYVVVAQIRGPNLKGEVWLRRVTDRATEQAVWLVTRRTVSEVPRWHAVLIKGQQARHSPAEKLNTGLGPLPGGLSLETPRETATLFSRLTREGSYERAAHLLDLSGIKAALQPEQGPRLARRLAMILKRVHPASFNRLSNDPMGTPEQGVPFDEEVVARTKLENSDIQVRLAQYPRAGGAPIWLFNKATVADIDPLYDTFGYGWAGDVLPPVFFEWQLWEIQLWQWLGLLLALVLGYIFGLIGSYVVRKLLLRLAKLTRWDWDDVVVAKMRGPLVGAFWALGFVIAVPLLSLSDRPRGLLLGGCKLVAILSLGWFVLRLMDVISEQLQKVFQEREDDMGMAMVPVASKILKPIVAVIILIVALQNVGMNVAGLLAGLGIGGLAFALAAKDTIANIFGSVAIAFDRPFKTGDFIKVGDFVGTVEEVGLRSTRIRTLARTIVAIPNSQMANSNVENYSVRDRMRVDVTLGVQYDTSLDQIRLIIDEIKRYLLEHPQWYPEGFAVRFAGFGPSSLDIQVVGYITTDDFAVYTGVREEIYMGLRDIIEQAGAEFAYPSQTVYVGKDSAADADKARLAAAEVSKRREAGELLPPEIPDEIKEAIQAEAQRKREQREARDRNGAADG